MTRSTVGAVVWCAVVLAACGRIKPLSDPRPAFAFRCQCLGEFCFLASDQDVGRRVICEPDGRTRVVQPEEVDTVVCTQAICSGLGNFCKASADVSCLAGNETGSDASPEALAALTQTCDEQCGGLGKRQYFTFADGGEIRIDSFCFGGGVQAVSTVKCGPATVDDPPPIPHFSPAYTSEADVLADSMATIDFLDGEAKVTETATARIVSGGIHLVPETCPTGTCDVTAWLGIGLAPFTAQNRGISNAAVVTKGPLKGQLDSNGILSIPSATFVVSGKVGSGGVAADFTNALPILAVVNAATGRVDMQLALSDANTKMLADVHAFIQRSPPTAAITAPTTVECTSPTGTAVTFGSGQTSDRQGASDLRSFYWYDGDFGLGAPSGHGPTLTTTLPLGSSEVLLRAVDSIDKENVAAHVVTVVDTSPPEVQSVDITPDCLWSPDHRFALFELGKNLVLHVKDACSADAAVKVSIADVQSSDGAGTGAHDPDVVFGTGAICLRAERLGGQPGRTYTVTLKVEDANGNSRLHPVLLGVPHDQRPRTRCGADAEARMLVEADDPRCTATIAAAAATTGTVLPTENARKPKEEPLPASCSTAGGGASGLLACFCLLMVRRRSRSSIRPKHAVRLGRSLGARGALVSALLSLAGCSQPPARSCVEGWWLGDATSCSLPCGQSNKPAECSRSDCEVRPFLGLLSDGTSVTGSLTMSPSARELSSWGPRTTSRWKLEGSQLQKAVDAPQMEATCNGNRMTLDGQGLGKALGETSTALQSAHADGGWSALRY